MSCWTACSCTTCFRRGIEESLPGQDRTRMDAGHLRVLLCVGDPVGGVGSCNGHCSLHNQSRANRVEKTVWLESWKSVGLVLRRGISPPLRRPLRRRLHLRAHDQWDFAIGHQLLSLFVGALHQRDYHGTHTLSGRRVPMLMLAWGLAFGGLLGPSFSSPVRRVIPRLSTRYG